MTAKESTPKSAIDTMMTHRSIRSFRPQPLPDGLLERLVTAGARASTSSNMQAYTVISITEPPLKARVAHLCGDQQQINESAAFLVFCADLHKLTLACEMHGQDHDATGYAEALLIAVVDTALVMQNVAVAAESLGLGMCMIGAMRNHPHDVARELKLPKNVMALAGMCLGWPGEADAAVKPRFPLGATLHPERYRSDEELRTLIDCYDRTQAEWYAERKLHPRDPRWSAVMSRRLPAVSKRGAVDGFLRSQGFLTQ